MEFKEIIYDKRDGIATITINRPEKYNACTPVTIYELSQAFTDSGAGEAESGSGIRARSRGRSGRPPCRRDKRRRVSEPAK